MPTVTQAETFERYRLRLYRASLGFLGAKTSEAFDMVHDTFLVSYPWIEEAEPGQPTFAWLRQICLRLCYSRLRDSVSCLACLDLDLKAFMAHTGLERVDSANLGLNEQQQLLVLGGWIKRLTPESRLMIELRNVHGMSYASISRTLNQPLEVIPIRLLNARLQLREALKGYPKSGSPTKLPVAA
jgi:RNA polymerase sigma factor (sigma-70 family)